MWLFKDVNLLSSSACKGGDHVLWKTTVTDDESKDLLNNVFIIKREVRGNFHALMFFYVVGLHGYFTTIYNRLPLQHMRWEVEGKI